MGVHQQVLPHQFLSGGIVFHHHGDGFIDSGQIGVLAVQVQPVGIVRIATLPFHRSRLPVPAPPGGILIPEPVGLPFVGAVFRNGGTDQFSASSVNFHQHFSIRLIGQETDLPASHFCVKDTLYGETVGEVGVALNRRADCLQILVMEGAFQIQGTAVVIGRAGGDRTACKVNKEFRLYLVSGVLALLIIIVTEHQLFRPSGGAVEGEHRSGGVRGPGFRGGGTGQFRAVQGVQVGVEITVIPIGYIGGNQCLGGRGIYVQNLHPGIRGIHGKALVSAGIRRHGESTVPIHIHIHIALVGEFVREGQLGDRKLHVQLCPILHSFRQGKGHSSCIVVIFAPFQGVAKTGFHGCAVDSQRCGLAV